MKVWTVTDHIILNLPSIFEIVCFNVVWNKALIPENVFMFWIPSTKQTLKIKFVNFKIKLLLVKFFKIWIHFNAHNTNHYYFLRHRLSNFKVFCKEFIFLHIIFPSWIILKDFKVYVVCKILNLNFMIVRSYKIMYLNTIEFTFWEYKLWSFIKLNIIKRCTVFQIL